MPAELLTDVLVPPTGAASALDVLDSLAAPVSEPFSDDMVAMCAEFSRRLARRAGPDPALQALAFWMRRSELVRLQAEYRRLGSADTQLVPRGLVFHLPPGNVDTIFVYSWLLSVLAGNTNVIRLSPERTGTSESILDVLGQVLADDGGTGPGGHTTVVSYGHDDEVTAAFSSRCDMRVVWGGDRTIRAVRALPLPPHATELTFGDRTSLAVVDAGAYLSSTHERRTGVAERLYNDAYLFDQLACSSPRLIVWVGAPDACDRASALLIDDLAEVVTAKGYRVDAATAMAKLTYRARAAVDTAVIRQDLRGNELAVLTVGEPLDVGPDFCGAGLFWQTGCQELGDLVPYLGRRHQTLAHFGFDPAALHDLARRLNGRGVDRLVPLGEALTFSRYWDGHDLVRAFLRTVYVQTEPRSR